MDAFSIGRAPIDTIDGSMGEGGGQILRTALALAVCLGRPIRLFNIRAARQRPGLQPQHLAAVKAAALISQAQVEGAEQHSQSLVFTPGTVKPGDYQISVGTAGSTTLVLQTILPALMLAPAPSRLVLEGGTHNPLAPPFEFLQHAFIPLLNRMGPTVKVQLQRAGFAPRGGGQMTVDILPAPQLQAIAVPERGIIRNQYAEVLLSHLPEHIAQRELAVLQQSLGYDASQLRYRPISDAYGPGNMVYSIIESEHITECFSAFGHRGVPAEQVAQQLVTEVQQYLQAGVPVGPHLADQLLLPMALAGGGRFVTTQPSRHTLTNIQVIKTILQREIHVEQLQVEAWQIRCC